MTIQPGETGEIPGGPFRGDTEMIVEVTVETREWTNTENIWVWVDADVTIHIQSVSQYGIGYWQERERWA